MLALCNISIIGFIKILIIRKIYFCEHFISSDIYLFRFVIMNCIKITLEYLVLLLFYIPNRHCNTTQNEIITNSNASRGKILICEVFHSCDYFLIWVYVTQITKIFDISFFRWKQSAIIYFNYHNSWKWEYQR